MSDTLDKLFHDFDRGRISRRQLFQALGLAAVGAAIPLNAFAQGRCGGENASRPECDKTPAKAPFDATGWKTISLDHFTMQAADYKKEVAYYATLMNWKIRSDNGREAVMDIGDIGSVLIQGGYQAPPAPPAPTPAPGDTAGGRGGGRGGGAARAPRNAVWDSFCWGIDQWDKNKVEAALKARGLNPVFETSAGVDTFRVMDPGGFTVRITDGKKNRRQGSSSAPMPAPAPFDKTDWNTVWLDHISFQCPNYKESVAFYEALLGWKGRGDEGSQNTADIGDVGGIIIRGGGPQGGRGGGAAPPPRRAASIDHISFGIQPWDPDKVRAELEKRGLSARVDTGGRGDIHTARFQSYHTTTPNGFDLQISNLTRATRNNG